jgi:hypothetical protein
MTDSAENVAGPWRYERLDGPGHWMQLDAPDQVNALPLDFLRLWSLKAGNRAIKHARLHTRTHSRKSSVVVKVPDAKEPLAVSAFGTKHFTFDVQLSANERRRYRVLLLVALKRT